MLKKTLAILVPGIVIALLIVKFSIAGDDNLFKNPSFEQTQQPNQYGHLFTFWGGWKYQQPCRLEIGSIARTGKFAYEMTSDQGGKIRLLSPYMKLSAGRYRIKYFMRGLSIGPGQWNIPLGLFVNFDGKNFNMKKSGTFGWTPVTYVFEIKEPVDNFMLGVGLFAGGWLWIDDASLVKVDESVPLTREPVIGSEEGPVLPPGELHQQAVHCRECGYRNNPEWGRCYACGHFLPDTKDKKDRAAVEVIADFENGKDDGFQGGTLVEDFSLQGRYCLSSDKAITLKKSQDWSKHDRFRIDVFNPGETTSPVYVEIQDEFTNSYWTRVNYNTVVPPGKTTITLATDLYVGEKARPGRPLLRDKISKLYIDTKGNRLLFDNFRLESLNVESVLFDGLTALDFGPADSPVMPGFRQATMAMMYEPGRGFGWSGNLWKAFNALQPDALFQDFVCPLDGVFRIDLPNDTYHVSMNIDSPGGYWGEVQSYSHRKVWANGRKVVDEKMDLESFKKKYFRNSSRDDLPGIDTFDQYVQKMSDIKEFDVEVSDGKLELKFKGEGFAHSLSSLVIYPADKAPEGKRFLRWVTDQRKAQFNDYFKQIAPKRVGSVAPQDGYVLFSRPFMKTVNVFDGPLEGEAILPAGLSLTVAQGEEMPLTFSVQPAGDIGAIDIEISQFTYAGPSGKNVRPLSKEVVKPGWLDYRITRSTMAGSVYTVAPRYWHPTPAPAGTNVTRSFWLRTTPPAGVEPGPYKGTVTIRPEKGRAQSIPVILNVLPFQLDPITDLAVGPWGIGMRMPWLYNNKDAEKWQWRMFEKTLDVLKESGSTSFSGVPHIKVKAEKGRISLDTSLADKEMALIRSKGFSHLLSAYGVSLSAYQMYGNNSGPDVAAADRAGFPDVESFLEAVYGAIDEHAVSHDWLPVAWNLCDEPVDSAVKGAATNALAHRKAAAGLKRTTFMGETSMTGKDPNNPHYDLVRALLIPSLNNHDEDSLNVLENAGNRFSFYNGESRWTYGRYMKMLKSKHNLALRLSWHYNIVAGDPYYALDCREDDYSWYNTDANQTMVPSVFFLGQILPGLNDYRYLSTLERLLKEKPKHPAADKGRKVFQEMMALTPGTDRNVPSDATQFENDRKAIIEAIIALGPQVH